MTTRLLILLAAVLLCWAAPVQAQTIKSLGYNTTNGQIVYTGTNALTFTNALSFGTNADTTRTNLGLGYLGTNAATTRTNLGLGLPALTNTSNITAMRALAGSTNASQPFTGSFTFVDDVGDVGIVVISNGIIVELQFP